MPGDAGSAVIKIKTSIDYSDLNSLEDKITNLENTPHTIKVKVEAADGQRGLNNLINGLNKTVKNASGRATAGVKNVNNGYSTLNRTMMKSEKLQQTIAQTAEKMEASQSEYGKTSAENHRKLAALAKVSDNMYKTGADSARQYKESIDVLQHRAELEKRDFDFRERREKDIAKAQKKSQDDAKKAAAETLKLSENDSALRRAQDEIDARRIKIAKELSNWTAAKNMPEYKSLQNAARELEELNKSKGSFTDGEYSKEFSRINDNAKEAETNIKIARKNTLSFGDKIKNAYSELSRYITPAMVLREGVQVVKQMAQASMDIESAMTRIQIVTGSTDTQMTQFFETASGQAQELGKGITDVAGSIEVFSRLGYGLDEATNLSKFANIMANVGDVSVDEATTGITSILKGFDLKASDAEHVSDVLVEVGQKYAISASELMQAFERGGAALHASGATFEESAALFAATNSALGFVARCTEMCN